MHPRAKQKHLHNCLTAGDFPNGSAVRAPPAWAAIWSTLSLFGRAYVPSSILVRTAVRLSRAVYMVVAPHDNQTKM